MSNKIKLTFWDYNDFVNYKPEWVRDWHDCGMTAPVAPRFSLKNESHEAYREMLDLAHSYGMSIIMQFNEAYLDNYFHGAEEYRKTIADIYEEFGSHPAVIGLYVGEEPATEHNEAYKEGVKLIREIAPDFLVYVNLGSIERTERMLLKGERSLESWICEFADYTKSNVMGGGQYSQLSADNGGIYEYFENIHRFVDAGKKCGSEIWFTPLSSAHYTYRVPTEDDYRWQLNTAVACGCKAIVWFRLYDKLIAADYHGSPIDEFGMRTSHFDDLARVQKRFNAHHAEIFARLNHVETYNVGVGYGGYLYFVPGLTDLVDFASARSALISFFKDDEGNDYIAVVNTLQREGAPITLSFTDKVRKAQLVYHNGEVLQGCFDRGDRVGVVSSHEIWLAPGQMELLKIN